MYFEMAQTLVSNTAIMIGGVKNFIVQAFLRLDFYKIWKDLMRFQMQ